jgi:hypothetical protein
MYLSGDASGVPMRQEELEGRKGKGADGKAKTRMANLGCVFTQHQVDDKGHPIRDPNSTTYVSTMGPVEEFGPLLRQEAIRRGLPLAMFVVLLIDGAEGLANMGDSVFPPLFKSWTSITRWSTPARCWRPCWVARSIPISRSDSDVRLGNYSEIKSNSSSRPRARNAPAPPELRR